MIRQTKEGWWIVDGDTHLGKWVEETGTLCHDQFACDYIKPFLDCGMSILDIGANIGTMTRFFLNQGAKVIAFEPQYEPYKCLKLNCPEADCWHYGLSDEDAVYIIRESKNIGASYLEYSSETRSAQLEASAVSLDSILPNYVVNFIKIDVEGFECKVLRGAKETICKYKPIIYCEVNKSALQRQGATKEELLGLLNDWGYVWKIVQPNCKYNDPQFDVLAEYEKH